MKLRLAFFAVALLLSWGAGSIQATPCPGVDLCNPLECDRSCRAKGKAGGVCRLCNCTCFTF